MLGVWPLVGLWLMLVHFSTLNVPRHMEESDFMEENFNKNAETKFKNRYGFTGRNGTFLEAREYGSKGYKNTG